jgi:hypothetical protein
MVRSGSNFELGGIRIVLEALWTDGTSFRENSTDRVEATFFQNGTSAVLRGELRVELH